MLDQWYIVHQLFHCRSQKALTDYYTKVNNIAGMYKIFLCSKCCLYIRGLYAYDKHVATCEKYKCSVCNKTFHSKQTYEKHYKVNCPPRRFSCHRCKKTYARSSDRDQHLRKCVVGNVFICEICNFKFLSAHWLEDHKSTNHV